MKRSLTVVRHAFVTVAALGTLVTVLAATPVVLAQDVGAGDRSMAFRPGLGEAAREHVPGGRLLVGAYSAVLILIGGYVVYIARRTARIERDLQRLESDLQQRRKPT